MSKSSIVVELKTDYCIAVSQKVFMVNLWKLGRNLFQIWKYISLVECENSFLLTFK